MSDRYNQFIEDCNFKFSKRMKELHKKYRLASHGLSPIEIPVTISNGLVYRAKFDYFCNVPNSRLYYNLYSGPGNDLQHHYVDLDFSEDSEEDIKTKEIELICSGAPDIISGFFRIWIEHKMHKICIMNMTVTVVKGDKEFERFNESDQYTNFGLLGKKGDKPHVLLMYSDRARSPLASKFYEYLGNTDDLPVKVHVTRSREKLRSIFAKMGYIPDYIYVGYGRPQNAFGDSDIVSKFGIKIIMEIGDLECLLPSIEIFKKHIAFLVGQTNLGWGNYGKMNSHLGHIKIIHIPWSINHKVYESNKDRDIDVAMVCSIGETWKWHENRRKIRDEILKLTKGSEKYKVVVKNVYGEEYRDILNRSKIIIVDTSMRQAVTQKYLEAAVSGALLVGDIPFNPEKIFVNRKTMVEVNPLNVNKKILQYLKDEKSRLKIANECKRIVSEELNHERVAEIFCKHVLKDWVK
jgi:hypothetical protein